MKKLVSLFFVAILFLGCQKKQSDNNNNFKNSNIDITKFINKAQETLKSKMPIEDFRNLNWDNLETQEITSKTPVLKVPSKLEKNKYVYYSVCNSREVYNWVIFNLQKDGQLINGSIALKAMNNDVLNILTIEKTEYNLH